MSWTGIIRSSMTDKAVHSGHDVPGTGVKVMDDLDHQHYYNPLVLTHLYHHSLSSPHNQAVV